MRAIDSRSISATVEPARAARPWKIASSRAVFVDPGITMFAVMPKRPSSPATVRTQFDIAARTTLLTPSPRIGAITLVLVTATRRPHAGRQRLQHAMRAADMLTHRALDLDRRRIHEESRRRTTRVRHEHVHRAESRDQGVGRALHRHRVGVILHEHLVRTTRHGLELAKHLREPFLVAAREHHARAKPRKGDRDRPSDALRRSTHQRDPTCERCLHAAKVARTRTMRPCRPA